MLANSHRPIPAVVQQHAEEAALLRHTRSVLVDAPHVKLHHLARLDERIAAHLDGLAVAGEYGSGLCEGALESPGTGEVFATAVGAIEAKDQGRLEKLYAIAKTIPEARRGLISAFGWVSAQHLEGIVSGLLGSADAFRRLVGIAACTMHGVDSGAGLAKAISDPEPALRARALRAAGESGRRDLLRACVAALKDENDEARIWAAWSAVLLGRDEQGVKALAGIALSPSPFREPALRLLLKVVDQADAKELLRRLASDPADRRLLILGSGFAGDPAYLPWLIQQMDDPKLSRSAGEAFALVTGLDLSFLDLDRTPPEDLESGPSENPEDDDVAMDPDESLPWPDPAKLQQWWVANSVRFRPGARYFMGAPVSREHCTEVLRNGFQRQRAAATEYLCLLNPGSTLFPIRAPAWRQKRWLESV
ncbi:TIGR02270 family protein [Thiocapsa bogorovii]|uniref:TIGR02270 family protein n=1 Tax=Thiocapsa bogorovii TaxID=521689 RepID=UPI001E5217D2|nr:TIGR02270 family protein [Thiocapsa bogorovii]UHD16112.1 TIGR02270 family protein [Thiocapsa bogorovii]